MQTRSVHFPASSAYLGWAMLGKTAFSCSTRPGQPTKFLPAHSVWCHIQTTLACLRLLCSLHAALQISPSHENDEDVIARTSSYLAALHGGTCPGLGSIANRFHHGVSSSAILSRESLLEALFKKQIFYEMLFTLFVK